MHKRQWQTLEAKEETKEEGPAEPSQAAASSGTLASQSRFQNRDSRHCYPRLLPWSVAFSYTSRGVHTVDRNSTSCQGYGA